MKTKTLSVKDFKTTAFYKFFKTSRFVYTWAGLAILVIFFGLNVWAALVYGALQTIMELLPNVFKLPLYKHWDTIEDKFNKPKKHY
ncbi:MAG: hypothetical protein CL596_04845 [Alteromonas sp.]|nr:hypothetical protein [Alteromonas sp.]|tara:strand:+ start:9750 stop:10007 length:258 start_codon:yes stop_codon:yes gene_type:complete